MKIQVITLFPEMFDKVLNSSMMWKAQERADVEFSIIDLREFGIGPRKQVDDPPYGGGDGMVLRPEPAVEAIEFAKKQDPSAVVYLPTPRGKILKQSWVKEIAKQSDKGIIVFCPRYEGYDERIIAWIDEQFSIGSYVLTGGEIPAMVLIDSVVRLIPGVLGGEQSAEKESFYMDDASVEHPQYTRPESFKNMDVPSVLLSGHHAEIEKWREENTRSQNN